MQNTEILGLVKPIRWKIFLTQVRVLTIANLKSRYRKTFAGFLWVVLNPLLMYAVQCEIFKTFLNLKVPNYYLFFASGLLPWIFVAQTLEMGTPTILWNGQLLKAHSMSPLVFLMSQITDNFINFIMAFFIVLIPLSFIEKLNPVGVLLLPIPLFFLVLGVLGIVWILATLQVFFRDTNFILRFTLSILYFMTPIFYPVTFIPENLRWIAYINPLYILIAPFRVCIYSFGWPSFFSSMIASVGTSFGFLLFGYLFWQRKKNDIYFNL